jgi:hypothetical protein
VKHIKTTSCDNCSIVVFRVLLHSNGSYPIVVCVFVAAGMSLPTRCLEMSLLYCWLRIVAGLFTESLSNGSTCHNM